MCPCASSREEACAAGGRSEETSPEDIAHLQRIEAALKRADRKLELRRLAADLPEASRALKREVAARRKMERELRRAREAANRTKSEFLANMSHELRTPLAVIMGMLELARNSGPLAPELRRYLDMAYSSSESLLLLIEDILDMARIKGDQVTLVEEDFDLPASIREAAEFLAVEAARKGIAFSLEVAPDVPQVVFGDGEKLRQVLFNLIGNAVKFTERGEVAVEVALAPGGGAAPRGRTMIAFSIRDTGIGIPADRVNRLFQNFSQLDSSLTRRFGGAGLGLAISKGIVERMGGGIRAESLIGSGSLFAFTVPFKARKTSVPSPAGAPGDGSSPDADPRPSRDVRILLVEDDPMVGQMVRMMLEKRGWSVRLATDGPEALSILGEETFDLVLMDVQMPGMNGLDVTRRIRGSEGPARALPIVALTAHARAEDQQMCLEAGMDDYLTKPVRMPQLYAAVEKHLGLLSGAATPKRE